MKKSRFGSWIIGFVLVGGVFALPAEGAVRRVDVNSSCVSSCDGSSWALAYTELRDALAAAAGGDEIWVADGTYYPSALCTSPCSTTDRAKTFNISNPAVSVWGGFAGTETLRTQRNPATNVTILSGDIDRDSNWNVDSDNSYHVVTYSVANASARLDGFTVMMGCANGTNDATHKDDQGGAIQIRSVSAKCLAGGPYIENCIIDRNYGSDHGAVNDHALSTYISDCTFTDNVAGVRGAALLVEHGSTEVIDCVFDGNSVSSVAGCQTTTTPGAGGAVWLGREASDASCTGVSEPTFLNCDFIDNEAEQGGAIWSMNSSFSLNLCLFKDNLASAPGSYLGGDCGCTSSQLGTLTNEGHGGAIWAGRTDEDCLPVEILIENTDFGLSSNPASQYNYAINKGGAIFLDGDDASNTITAVIDRCDFYGERTAGPSSGCLGTGYSDPQGGGAIWAKDATLTIRDSSFIANQTTYANYIGSAVYAQDSTLLVDDCSFNGNNSRANGTVYTKDSPSTWNNTVFSGNWVTGGESSALEIKNNSATLTNCTFSANARTDSASSANSEAVQFNSSGTLAATNTIFWDELAGGDSLPSEIKLTLSSTLTLTNCDVRGGQGQIVNFNCGSCTPTTGDTMTNCINSDPLFTDANGADNVLGTADDNLHLGSTSPCKNTGTNTGLTLAFDIEGSRRIADTTVDIGAYERCAGNGDCLDSDCASGRTCSSGVCGGSVTAIWPTCNSGADYCEGVYCMTDECSHDDQCAGGEVCCSHSCETGDCCDDSNCSGATPVCVSNDCVECSEDCHCIGDLPYCVANECVECTSNGHCDFGDICCNNVCQNWDCCVIGAGCGHGSTCCDDHTCQSFCPL